MTMEGRSAAGLRYQGQAMPTAAPLPPQAIAPLKQRLAELRATLATPPLDVDLAVRGQRAIDELEALIKRLENPNVPRAP